MDEQPKEEINRGLTKKERRQLRRAEKKEDLAREKGAKTKKSFLTLMIICAVVGVGIFGIVRYFSGLSMEKISANVLESCVNHGGISMHIHPHLSGIKNGEVLEIPANIGVSIACMRPIHTHDKSGQLHVEFPRQHDFTLGDFFSVWDKPFPSAEKFSMTVNGEENSAYKDLILRDGDRIEIKYDER